MELLGAPGKARLTESILYHAAECFALGLRERLRLPSQVGGKRDGLLDCVCHGNG
jgi:hypothetical protein